MRSGKWLLALGIATAVANATAASEERSPLATCGHYEELAAALNMPLGTVKTHLHRAKRQLR